MLIKHGNVALVVLGDDTGIVAPSNTSIFPWLDFPLRNFSPASRSQLQRRSLGEGTVHRRSANAGILFTVWTLARSPTKPHSRKNKKAIDGWKSPTKTELLVWKLPGGF